MAFRNILNARFFVDYLLALMGCSLSKYLLANAQKLYLIHDGKSWQRIRKKECLFVNVEN